MTSPTTKTRQRGGYRATDPRPKLVAVAGRVPPEVADAVLKDCRRLGVNRSRWVGLAIREKLERAA